MRGVLYQALRLTSSSATIAKVTGRRVLEFIYEERSTVANSNKGTPLTAARGPVKTDLALHRTFSDCGVGPVQPAGSVGSTAPRGNALVRHHIPGSALEAVPARQYDVAPITSHEVSVDIGFISVSSTEDRVAVTIYTCRSQSKMGRINLHSAWSFSCQFWQLYAVNINRVHIESKVCRALWQNLNRALFLKDSSTSIA